MQQRLCVCHRWIVEVEPGVWAHEDDMLACAPAESLPLTYLEEVA
jgi:hypothetical protein